jgi:predicted DNA-binding protein
MNTQYITRPSVLIPVEEFQEMMETQEDIIDAYSILEKIHNGEEKTISLEELEDELIVKT